MKSNQQKLRFLAVGGFNTLLDFGLLFIFKAIGLPVITANIFSTTIAFCFSFIANKKYTFKSTDTNIKREIFLFILVTLFGLWVLQTIIIQTLLHPLIATGLSSELSLFVAKLIATAATMVWNYIGYSRLVFKDRSQL